MGCGKLNWTERETIQNFWTVLVPGVWALVLQKDLDSLRLSNYLCNMAGRDVKGKTFVTSAKTRKYEKCHTCRVINHRMAQKRHHCVFLMQSVRFISNPFFTIYTLFHLLSVQKTWVKCQVGFEESESDHNGSARQRPESYSSHYDDSKDFSGK